MAQWFAVPCSKIENGADVYCLNIAPEQDRVRSVVSVAEWPAWCSGCACFPQVVAGVPKNHDQVDCPTCGILIAVPPDMDEFECPRCDTVCRAPPKVRTLIAAAVFMASRRLRLVVPQYSTPEAPAQFKKQLSLHRAASRSSLKSPPKNSGETAHSMRR